MAAASPQDFSLDSLFGLDGRTALGSGGLGLAMAKGLSRNGARVGIVTYLASRAGSYTTGAVIPVDGGTSISKGYREWMGPQHRATIDMTDNR